MLSGNELTPLILACGRGTPGSPTNAQAAADLQALATAKPNLLNTPTNSRAPELPLDGALYWGSFPAAVALIAAGQATGVTPRCVGGAPLQQAASSCNPKLAQWVWDTGLDRNLTPAVGENAVMNKAPDDERVQTVQFLLTKGLEVSDLMAQLAIQTYPGVAQILVTSGALPAEGVARVEPLILPATRNPLGFALLPSKLNDLYVAVYSGNVGKVQATIAAGSPVNIVLPGASRLGSPLHYALRLGLPDVARTLIAAGADPAALSPWGQSIVGAAALSGHTPALRLAVSLAPGRPLVDAVERKFSSNRDTTPLVACILSAVPNVVDAVTTLLAANADPLDGSTVGVPPAFWPSYITSAGTGMTPAIARLVILALAAGNASGVKANLDTVCPAVGKSARALAAERGVPPL